MQSSSNDLNEILSDINSAIDKIEKEPNKNMAKTASKLFVISYSLTWSLYYFLHDIIDCDPDSDLVDLTITKMQNLLKINE